MEKSVSMTILMKALLILKMRVLIESTWELGDLESIELNLQNPTVNILRNYLHLEKMRPLYSFSTLSKLKVLWASFLS